MSLLEKHLMVKHSTIPGAGKGLFTKKMIPKGTRIIEYTGKISVWKEVDHKQGQNRYIYYCQCRNFPADLDAPCRSPKSLPNLYVYKHCSPCRHKSDN